MKRFRIVVVGCGNMANAWVGYALTREDSEIVALVDISKENAERMAERHGLTCGIYPDVAIAIAETGGNVAFDITIPDSRFDVSRSALQASCHVFAEKPMAVSLEEAHELVRTADRAGRRLSIMQNRRYNGHIRSLRGLITDGTIGPVGYIGADFFLGPHFGGFREAMEHPLIVDMAIHTFDQARFIGGADPVSVYCQPFNPPGSWFAGAAAAVCIFEMSDGSIFCYRGSWCAEGAPTSWEASWRITGANGTAIWDGTGEPYAEIVPPGIGTDQSGFLREHVRIEANNEWRGRERHTGCLDEMFAALQEGRPAETDARDNLKSIAMVLGAVESAEKGLKIDLRPYWNL